VTQRDLALMSATAIRLADGITRLQRLATSDGCELVLSRQAMALVEQFDLLRHYLRQAALVEAISAAPPGVAGPDAKQAQAARKTALAMTGKAAGGRARADKLSAARRRAIASKAAQARWTK
jgi:hypothetical protein